MTKDRKKLDIQANKFGRSDLVRIGLFSEPQYVSSGEAYNSKKNASSLDFRASGKQFLTSPSKSGHDCRDAYFDKKFTRLFENEIYTDVVVLRRRWRNQAKEKNITNIPFKPSSVPPKPSGKGSHWGTIQQQWPIESKPLELPPQPEKEPGKTHEPRNFLTAPPKKGSGYGYPNVTIGQPYPYESDPFGYSELIERKERAENKKKDVGERPFVSASSTREFFNEFAGITTESENSKEFFTSSSRESTTKLPSIPFKPTSHGGYTINPYPSYIPPKKPEIVQSGEKHEPIFKPTGVTGSYPIRSIIEVTTPIAPSPRIQAQLKAAFTA